MSWSNPADILMKHKKLSFPHNLGVTDSLENQLHSSLFSSKNFILDIRKSKKISQIKRTKEADFVQLGLFDIAIYMG